MDERASNSIGRNVARAREKAGLTQAELTKRIGAKAQNTIAAIEAGTTRKSKYLPDIARELNVGLRDLDPSFAADEAVRLPGRHIGGTRDLPVHGSVEAGEGAVVVSNEPVDMILRPAPLENVVGAYGVIVVGESMVPVVRPGQVVMVNPHLPPKAEDLCLFIFDDDGDFRATLKEYCGQTKDAWTVKRYSPKERVFPLSKREWPKCHVVVSIDRRR